MPSPGDGGSPTTAAVLIRPAGIADAEAISRLVTHTLRMSNAADYSPAIIDGVVANFTPAHIASRMHGRRVWVASREDGIIGTASLDGDVVRTVFVDPGHQGTGVGAALMRHVEAHAAATAIALLTVPSSLTAQGFYAHLGYRAVREAFHGDERTIVMVKDLTLPA
jgi:GNAT superfamily N-acetyltransferase